MENKRTTRKRGKEPSACRGSRKPVSPGGSGQVAVRRPAAARDVFRCSFFFLFLLARPHRSVVFPAALVVSPGQWGPGPGPGPAWFWPASRAAGKEERHETRRHDDTTTRQSAGKTRMCVWVVWGVLGEGRSFLVRQKREERQTTEIRKRKKERDVKIK